MKVFTRKRVFWILVVVAITTVTSFLPSLPKSEPKIEPTTIPNTQATRQAEEGKAARQAHRSKWLTLDPNIPVIIWYVTYTGTSHTGDLTKKILGKTTVGFLLSLKTEGYAIEPPPDASLTNAIVYAELDYAHREELTSQAKFDKLFGPLTEREANLKYYSLGDISNLISNLEQKEPVNIDFAPIVIAFSCLVGISILSMIIIVASSSLHQQHPPLKKTRLT